MSCPCGGVSLQSCCGPYLAHAAKPATAEALMRARYTAFTLADMDYILGTHHPATVKKVDRDDTESWARDSIWQGLQILATRGGGPEDQEGTVEFIARFSYQDEVQEHHELAHFVRHEGDWIYHDGKIRKGEPVRRADPKVGRNDPCPCGSGKKFKKCCGTA
ncbi:MAG: YchJ family protein [Planctomycetes bacterium]|nr:YchJ family protein [Planctomycetota bacterium]